MNKGTTKITWHRLGELYLRGLLVILAILLAGYLLDAFWSLLENIVADKKIAVAILVSALLLPLPLGWIQHNLLRKVFERTRPMRALGRMEDRLVSELAADDRRGYPVVLVNHPSDEIRSLGLVTATIAGKEHGTEFAAVFLPRGPGHGIKGNIRIVNVEDLEYTDWDLRTFLQHHMSHGSSSPGHFDKAAWLESRKTMQDTA